MFARLFYSQLPVWGRPSHPIMRAILGSGEKRSWRSRIFQLFLLIGSSVFAVLLGYVIAQGASDEPTVREILYYPLIGAQTIALLLALALTANVIAFEKQKQTWDSLKLTTTGASLTLRARWLSVYFRLWWLLVPITLGRLVYVGYLLNDLTEFQGRALDLYISGITPEISLDVAILLITAQMTGFVLLPFVAIGLGGAIGLLLAALTRSRSIAILGMLLLVGLRLAITVSGLIVGNTVINNEGLLPDVFEMETTSAWTRILFVSAEGDMGLRLLRLDTLGQIWADVENSVYIGAAFLGLVLAQAVVANIVVLLASWMAARPARD